MPIFAYAYLTHDRRWTGPRAYRITIYQDDTLMFRTFNEREEVLDTDFFYLVPGTAAKLTVQMNRLHQIKRYYRRSSSKCHCNA